jgi:hypothetical protein
LKHEEKLPEKVKVAKASLPSHAADTNTTCFKCGKVGHLRKDCKEGKTTTSQSGGFCSGCGVKGHNEAKYWKLHPELKPTGSKGTKAGGIATTRRTKRLRLPPAKRRIGRPSLRNWRPKWQP